MKIGNDAVACSYCGLLLSTDFTYYSLDFYSVQVSNRSKNKSTEVILSTDLCEGCIELLKDRIKSAYIPPSNNKFNCDISGEIIIVPLFTYYLCKISKVDVNLSLAPYICDLCNKPKRPADGPCDKCTDKSKLIQSANIIVDDQYLEFNCSSAVFDKFKIHLEHIRIGDLANV